MQAWSALGPEPLPGRWPLAFSTPLTAAVFAAEPAAAATPTAAATGAAAPTPAPAVSAPAEPGPDPRRHHQPQRTEPRRWLLHLAQCRDHRDQ